jgi:DNA repair exonuclease SbcCD ATPase subunit
MHLSVKVNKYNIKEGSKMSERIVSTRVAVQGEAQFKQAFRDCNNEIRTFGSELSLVESQYRNNANSMEALKAKAQTLENVKASLANKQKEMQKAYDGATLAQDIYSQKVAEAKEKIARTESELANLKNTTGDTSEEQKKLTANLEAYKAELANAEANQKAAERAVNDYTQKLNANEIEINKNSDAINKNNKHLAEADESSNKTAKSIDEYGNSTEKAAEATDNLSEVLAAAGIYNALKKIVAIINISVNAWADYDVALSAIQARTGMAGDDISKLGDTFRELARNGNQSSQEIAGAYAEIALRGQDVAHSTGN